MGHVTLEPNGGQVPWHNQEQEEIYFIVEGTGEMCLGEERMTVASGQAVYIPHLVFHQLTNIGATPLRMIYCYGPAGDVAHWRQELDGTLPRAGIEAPPLPDGSQPQTPRLRIGAPRQSKKRSRPANISIAKSRSRIRSMWPISSISWR